MGRVAAAVMVVLLTGCSAPSRIATPSTPPFFSRDGTFRYHIPKGWFDAPADSLRTNNIIWLLRSDYAATIALSEIETDSTTRLLLRTGGLDRLAQLTMALASGGESALVRKPPGMFQKNGRTYCSYEVVTSASKDAMRVVLFAAGERVYEVTAVAKGSADWERIVSAQQAFLESLSW